MVKPVKLHQSLRKTERGREGKRAGLTRWLVDRLIHMVVAKVVDIEAIAFFKNHLGPQSAFSDMSKLR